MFADFNESHFLYLKQVNVFFLRIGTQVLPESQRGPQQKNV